MSKRKLVTEFTISKLDLIRTRSFQFALQRWVMFITVFVSAFLVLWNFDFFNGSIIARVESDYPILVWKFFLIFTLYMVAHPLVRNTAESYNRSIHSWISTILLIVYAVCLVVFSGKVSISNIDSIKLIHFVWLIPAISLPIAVKVIGIMLTWRLSPIQSSKLLFSALSLLFTSGVMVCSILLFNHLVIEKIQFSINDKISAIIVSMMVIGTAFAGLFTMVGWYKYRKINFSSMAASIPLLVVLPIFGAILVWIFKGTMQDMDLNKTPELWFLLGCVGIIVGLISFTLLFAKELKIAKVMNTLFATVLVAIWIGVFVYVNYFGIINKSYIIVDIAAATSLIVFVMMALFDKTTKVSLMQETLFTWMIVIMMVLILFFTIVGKAKLFDALLEIAPIDLKALLPVLLIALPGLYFTISVTKILWAQSRITHGIRIEKAIKKRKVKELLAQTGDQNE